MHNNNRPGKHGYHWHFFQYIVWLGVVAGVWLSWVTRSSAELPGATALQVDSPLTHSDDNHILTNIGVWSADSRWIYYDIRSDLAGSEFDGDRIERVEVATGRVEVVYTSERQSHCGVVTCSPADDRVVFIHGPENPTEEWQYAAWHRYGMLVDLKLPGEGIILDARDLIPPFTAGALRGGTHVHVFSGDGRWVSFTYEDHVLQTSTYAERERNQRNVGVTVLGQPVRVPRHHPRNHDGAGFSVLVTRTSDAPQAGSDEIQRAYSDAWVGSHGYVRADGTRQRRAIAFLGDLLNGRQQPLTELFIVDLPDQITVPSDGPLAGTETTRPRPPAGTRQRRLTSTEQRRFAGIQGPRHWPRSSPDGSRIAFLMKDDRGLAQLWTISPEGGVPRQLTNNAFSVESAFSWRPDGREIAFVGGRSVCVVSVPEGTTERLSHAAEPETAPRPEACVFSPDGRMIAYLRPQWRGSRWINQIHVSQRFPLP